MAVTVQNNISKQCEAALKAALIAQGGVMLQAELFYNFFQVPDQSAREFPQIQCGLGADVPDGFQSNSRILAGEFAAATHYTDDKLRSALSAIYAGWRNMITAANANPTTWGTTYLPATYTFGAITVLAGGAPFIDDNVQVITTSFEMEICIHA